MSTPSGHCNKEHGRLRTPCRVVEFEQFVTAASFEVMCI